MANGTQAAARPNILLITCDQYRFPRFSYGREAGFAEPLKEILGFRGSIDDTNPYAKFFPGLLRLRRNAVALTSHFAAASACTPSRGVIYTGQYGTKTGVTQTDGLFKSGDSPNFPWLAADGIPTLGAWMRQAGYSTHYFGKWHLSDPPDHSLDAYGFSDWELSYPEPHGALVNNLGVYRDLGFADSACTFLRRKGLALDYDRVYAGMEADDPATNGPDTSYAPPWFAVASFTNPHDIATYPSVISQALPNDDPDSQAKTQPIMGPLTVPKAGDLTPAPIAGTFRIPLNPLDFPQDCANPAPTQDETLEGKPTAQHEAAYKVGLGFAAKTGYNLAANLGKEEMAVPLSLQSSMPFQLSDDPDGNALLFLQFYAWLHYVLDAHVDAVLTALEESGQAANTIVVFLADHGEYGAAHGMMIEKWHTGYEEMLHVPMVVRFPGGEDSSEGAAPEPEHFEELTSHLDIVPTILGLAGVDSAQREAIRAELAKNRPVPPLPGADLSETIRRALNGGPQKPVTEPDGEARKGILYITDDEITQPLPYADNVQNQHSDAEFEVFCEVVEAVRTGKGGKGPVALAPGAVKQPNHVRCVRTKDYKLARYFDPSGARPQEWEMYDLHQDPNEEVNLVEVAVSPPTARDLPHRQTNQRKADELAALLAELEAKYL